MIDKNDKNSAEELVINYLKKNKNFFIKHPEITKELNFSLNDDSSNKIVNLDAYRLKKISQDNIKLQNQMTQILLAGKNHLISQKRILKASIKILSCKSIDKIISVILIDFKSLLGCDVINCYSTDSENDNKNLQKINLRLANSYFKEELKTNLDQNPKGVLVYFPNNSKLVKSYILLKININKNIYVIVMGSKDPYKFSANQQVDLIDYLVRIIEFKFK